MDAVHGAKLGWRPRPPVSIQVFTHCPANSTDCDSTGSRALAASTSPMAALRRSTVAHSITLQIPHRSPHTEAPTLPAHLGRPARRPEGVTASRPASPGRATPNARRACAYDRSPRPPFAVFKLDGLGWGDWLAEMCRVASIGLVVTVIWGGSGRVCEVRAPVLMRV
ncbi:hypothetical protein PHLGIDRAFT_229423 [Phlebiopsis gigantea 11061_1 CR5-6]|uniref:Uncharacterized protein n=1 Tax=Phlebiopsis gigantea (strain 11061_1 CR5-6) TaxID=745531 RepID=A0A0C3S260_PHLG1|nr:hypothetical protein PHLGIDRAFT_229423 [Phlebiopsis gigantea 11061_1 CR5-6]